MKIGTIPIVLRLHSNLVMLYGYMIFRITDSLIQLALSYTYPPPQGSGQTFFFMHPYITQHSSVNWYVHLIWPLISKPISSAKYAWRSRIQRKSGVQKICQCEPWSFVARVDAPHYLHYRGCLSMLAAPCFYLNFKWCSTNLSAQWSGYEQGRFVRMFPYCSQEIKIYFEWKME